MDNDNTHLLLREFPIPPMTERFEELVLYGNSTAWVPGIWQGFPALRDRRDRVCWAGINDNWSATRYEVQEQARRYCRMLDGMKTDRMRLDTLRPAVPGATLSRPARVSAAQARAMGLHIPAVLSPGDWVELSPGRLL